MSIQLSGEQYLSLWNRCMYLIKTNRTLGTREATQYPNIPYNTIQYIYRQCYHQLETEQEKLISSNINLYMEKYNHGYPLKKMVEEESLYLPIFLRLFVKAKYNVDDITANRYLHNPTLIDDSQLISLINECDWSSITEITNHDKIRQSSGLEYEYILKEHLRNIQIPYRTEAQMRLDGMPKTPDIILDYPIFIKEATYPFISIV